MPDLISKKSISDKEVIENVLIINSAIKAIKEKNNSKLKELSNQVIHDASIFQDADSISLAVVIYSLSKILERKGVVESSILISLEKLKIDMQQQNKKMAFRTLRVLIQKIAREDSSLKMYITEVLDQAKIKKSGKLYELGLSISKSADLLGVSYWELANYVGKTTAGDVKPRITVRDRFNYTRSLFK